MQHAGAKIPDPVGTAPESSEAPPPTECDILACCARCSAIATLAKAHEDCPSAHRAEVTYGGMRATPKRSTAPGFERINLPLSRGSISTSLLRPAGDGLRDRRSVRSPAFSLSGPNQRWRIQSAVGRSTSSAPWLESCAHQPWRRWPDTVGRDLDEDVYFRFFRRADGFSAMAYSIAAGSMERKLFSSRGMAAMADVKRCRTGGLDRKKNTIATRIQPRWIHGLGPDSDPSSRGAAEAHIHLILVINAVFADRRGIGIMNIMPRASPSGRARRHPPCLGAKQRHITLQFLIERQ